MEKISKHRILYYVRISIVKNTQVHVYEAPFVQSKILETLYRDAFLPVYETYNGFFLTTEGWIQKACIKDAQKIIPTNITDTGIWIIGNFIPRTNKNRPCKQQNPEFIVCEWSRHCASPGCSQVEWADYLRANEAVFSNHYTVSSDLIIQHIPDYEEAYIDPLRDSYELRENTVFIKICDDNKEKAWAVGDSLCRLLHKWYGHLNVIKINDRSV